MNVIVIVLRNTSSRTRLNKNGRTGSRNIWDPPQAAALVVHKT